MQLHPPGFAAQLETRLLRGEHLSLFGPRGGGKSTLLAGLHARFLATGTPCAYSTVTTCLEDITRAMERAYPWVLTGEIPRRAARGRLWIAADQLSGILLLDHFAAASNAMVCFLKRLHGKIAGVLTAIDCDDHRELARIRRPSRYGAMSVRMPVTPRRELHRLLHTLTGKLALPPFASSIEHRLLESALGRPGWIVKCAELACESRYWCEHGLLVSALCIDTETAVRYRALNMFRPPVAERPGGRDYPIDSGQSPKEGGSTESGLMTPKQAGV